MAPIGLYSHDPAWLLNGVYAGTKFAVRAIMETLREKVAQTIKVTTIFPGATQTELEHDIIRPKIKALWNNLQGMPKWMMKRLPMG
jgi:NADP-dependent 3-hydroxy acid dehydrogenase YdfG